MEPFAAGEGFTIYHGDCLAVMAALQESSVDAVICDPPYGLTQNKKGGSGVASVNLASPYGRARVTTGNGPGGFMGKAWDAKVPGPEVWAEALRVAKPGAHLVAFGGTRTFHRLTCAIEDGGWEIRDCLSWIYASGFPKSLNVAKAIDKAARGAPQGGPDPESAAHGRFKGGCSEESPEGRGFGAGPGQFMRRGVEDREYAVATGTGLRNRCAKCDKPFFSADPCKCPKPEPVTEEGKKWAGWGTALKPAWEPIILARKPLDGTVAGNFQKHGTGGLNIDGCRIATEESLNGGAYSGGVRPSSAMGCTGEAGGTSSILEAGGGRLSPEKFRQPEGRWPANVVLDEQAGVLLDQQAGECGGYGGATSGSSALGQGSGWNEHENRPTMIERIVDSGGPSRFFFVSKETPCQHRDPANDAASRSSPSRPRGGSAPSPAPTRAGPRGSEPGPDSTGDSARPTPSPSPAPNAALRASTDTTPTTPTYCASCGSALPATEGLTSPGDTGRAADASDPVSGMRFLYTAKSSRSEREEGLENFAPVRRSDGRAAIDGPGGNNPRLRTSARKNDHPTVKPLDLMRWLVRLVTPPGGVVLDPFMGSGSTLKAAREEFHPCIGIDMTERYCLIAKARLSANTLPLT